MYAGECLKAGRTDEGNNLLTGSKFGSDWLLVIVVVIIIKNDEDGCCARKKSDEHDNDSDCGEVQLLW